MRVGLGQAVVGGQDELSLPGAEALLKQIVDPCERALEAAAAEAADVAELVDRGEHREHDLPALAEATTQFPRGAVVSLSPEVGEVGEQPDRVPSQLAALGQVLRDRTRRGPCVPPEPRPPAPVLLPLPRLRP